MASAAPHKQVLNPGKRVRCLNGKVRKMSSSGVAMKEYECVEVGHHKNIADSRLSEQRVKVAYVPGYGLGS